MRITPAYAGKREVSRISFPIYEDHPRLCGEKSYSHVIFRHCSGSPPPMRGKAVCYGFGDDAERITPAYAGKSNVGMINIRSEGDHPRLCGEKATNF